MGRHPPLHPPGLGAALRRRLGPARARQAPVRPGRDPEPRARDLRLRTRSPAGYDVRPVTRRAIALRHTRSTPRRQGAQATSLSKLEQAVKAPTPPTTTHGPRPTNTRSRFAGPVAMTISLTWGSHQPPGPGSGSGCARSSTSSPTRSGSATSTTDASKPSPRRLRHLHRLLLSAARPDGQSPLLDSNRRPLPYHLA